MTDDSNTYEPTAAMHEAVVSQQSPVAHTATFVMVVALGNAVLGALDYVSELTEFAKWGVYVGEYLVVSIWFAWGPGEHLRRFVAVAWIGIIWMCASWVGFGIANPRDAFGYTHEKQQMLTVMPFAFATSSLPLWLMRVLNWEFHGPSICSRLPWLTDHLSIALFAFATLYCFYVDTWVSSDLMIAAMIGVLLGVLALTLAPLLVLAFLGMNVRISCLVLALVCMPLPALAFVSLFPMPGASGVGGAHYAYWESTISSSSAFASLGLVFVLWRRSGIRYVKR